MFNFVLNVWQNFCTLHSDIFFRKGLVMLNYKPLFLLYLCSVYQISLYSFNPKKIINDFWKKTEQEEMHKDLSLPDGSTVELSAQEGSILIKPWNQQKISIEAQKSGTQEELKDTTIAIKAPQAKTAPLTITTRTPEQKKAAIVNFTLIVPPHTSLIIRGSSGTVKVMDIDGMLDVSLAQGDIDISNATKSVIAKTGEGVIKVKQKQLDKKDSLFTENGSGNTHLYIPRETPATVHARTLAGVVTSEHAITLAPQTVKLNKDTWARIKKEIDGTIGTGGAPITLEATKGNISIEEY
jgi:hypothetical protein